MINYFRFWFIGFASCLIVVTQYSVNKIPEPIAPKNNTTVINQKLLKQVDKIAVKVTVNKTSGSGIIIQNNNNIYTIVTNRHVINHGEQYQIKTVDNYNHLGKLFTIALQEDLAILKFISDRSYSVAKINTTPLNCMNHLSWGIPINKAIELVPNYRF